MVTKQTTTLSTKTLSLSEKEAIIAKKVAEFEWPKGKVFFYIDGGGTTRTLRDMWASDKPAHAIKTGVEGFGMDAKTVIDICTGKMMVIGDSRIDSYPGGLEGVEDDGRFEDSPISVEDMVARLEDIFLSNTARANAAQRDYDILLGLPTRDGHEARGPFKKGKGRGGDSKLKVIEGCKEKAKEALEGLSILYPLVGKSMADLPMDKMPVYPSDMEDKYAEREWDKFEMANKTRAGIKDDRSDMPSSVSATPEVGHKGTREFLESYADPRDRKRMADKFKLLTDEQLDSILDDLNAGNWAECERALNVMTRWPAATEADLPSIGSAWITPEGEIFGGRAYAFIHHNILHSLHEGDYFKDLPYGGDEEQVEFNGWIKLSGGHGFMMWNHKRGHSTITESQKDAIIDLCLAQGLASFEWNGGSIELKEFVNASCDDIMNRF
jgi:hypothetical protein